MRVSWKSAAAVGSAVVHYHETASLNLGLVQSNPARDDGVRSALCAFLRGRDFIRQRPGGGEILLQGQKMSSDGSFLFFFEAKRRQSYPIGASPDFLHWTLLTNVVPGTGSSRTTGVDRGQGRLELPATLLSNPSANGASNARSNMVLHPPGTFTMGSPESEVGRGPTKDHRQ